jgi:hypothetical protein
LARKPGNSVLQEPHHNDLRLINRLQRAAGSARRLFQRKPDRDAESAAAGLVGFRASKAAASLRLNPHACKSPMRATEQTRHIALVMLLNDAGR